MAIHYIRKGEVKLLPAEAGKWEAALAMYHKGKSFMAAGVLLKQSGGGDGYVVLYLLCLGIEIILKALLLMKDFDTHWPLLKRHGYGHDLVRLVDAAQIAFNRHPISPSVKKELARLNELYNGELLRYVSALDLFIEPSSVEIGNVLLSILAVGRITERELLRRRSASG